MLDSYHITTMHQAKKHCMEAVIFVVFVAMQLEAAVTSNFILHRTCYIINGFDEGDCALLGTGSTDNITIYLENLAQPHASVILMVKLILEYVVPAVWCFFLGSWSDRYGRKPVLIWSTLGYGIAYLIMLIVSVIPSLSPWYMLIAYLPISITGGVPCIYFAVFCYISDVTSETNRGFRLGVLYGCMYIGSLLGGLSSSYIFEVVNYHGMYSICLSLCFLAWLFMIAVIDESLEKCETENRFANLINVSLISGTLKTAFRYRPFFGRPLLLMVVFTEVIFYVSYNSEAHIVYLFVRERFQWSLTEITIYNSLSNVLWLVGNVSGAYILHKLFAIQEIYIILAGIFCGVIGSMWQGLATETWHIYAGVCCKWLGGAVIPMTMSVYTKIVSTEEYGKIMSFVTVCETLSNLAVTPLYTWVYNHTLHTYPGAYNFLTASICLLGVSLTIILAILARNRNTPENEMKS